MYTAAVAINPAGAITGSYYTEPNAAFEQHGFLRARDGTIITFDAPGVVDTLAYAINPAGQSWVNILMETTFMASCGPPTASSPQSTPRAPCTPMPTPSTRRE